MKAAIIVHVDVGSVDELSQLVSEIDDVLDDFPEVDSVMPWKHGDAPPVLPVL